MRQVFTRSLYRAGLAAVGIYLAYALPVNVLLFTHYFPWLVSSGQGKSFNLSYGFAWSWIPGRLDIRSLELQGTDPNVHWDITLSRLTAKVKLSRLFHREFYVERLWTDQVVLDIQQHTEAAKPHVLEVLREDDLEKKSPDPWTVHLKLADIHSLRHAQIDSFFFAGNSDVLGEMILKPGQRLEVTGHWLIKGGTIKTGDTIILTEVNGTVTTKIHPTDLPSIHGSQIFRTMDIQADLKSRVFDAQVFGLLLRPYRPLRFGKTVGALTLDASVDHGTIQPRSKLDASLADLDLYFSGASLHGAGDIHWKVTQESLQAEPVSRLNLKLHELIWKGGKNAQAPLAEMAQVSLDGEARELSLVDPFTDIDIRLGITDNRLGKIQDLLNHFAQPSSDKPAKAPLLTSRLGRFELKGRIIPNLKKFDGVAEYSTSELRFSHEGSKTQLRTAFRSSVRLSSSDYEKGRFDLDHAAVTLDRIDILENGKSRYDTSEWKANVALGTGKADFSDSFRVAGDLSFEMTNAKLPVKYASPDNFWISLSMFLFPMKGLHGKGELRIEPEEFSLTTVTADSSSGKISGSFVAKDGEVKFAALVGFLPLDLCVDFSSDREKDVSLFSAHSKCKKAEEKISQEIGLNN